MKKQPPRHPSSSTLATGPDVRQTWRKTRWVTLTLLLLAGVINFLDRSSLSIANRSIRSELHLSGTQIGALLSAFSLAYGLSQLPIGPLLDRFGARRVLGTGLGVWSLAQMLTGTVTGLRSFVPLRVLLGMGEAPFFPASVKLVRERFMLAERGRAMAAVNVSTTLGQGLAPPLLTVLMLHFGWRHMFMLIGALGLLLALVWFPLLRDRRAPDENVDQRSTEETAPVSISFQQWSSLFRSRTIWGLMIGFGGINYTAWFYIAWLPSYLEGERLVSVALSGWLAAIPFLAGSLGMYLSGVVADRKGREGQSLAQVHRKQILLGMMFSAAFTLLAARAANVGMAVACISMALFSIHFAGTSAWGYVQAASPRPIVATVGSIQNFGSFVVASAAPVLTGWLLDRTHSFKTAFLFCAAMALLGAASYFALVRNSIDLTSNRLEP